MPPSSVLTGQSPIRAEVEVLCGEQWRVPFRPLVRQGDLQTILGRYWPRFLDEQRYPTASRIFETESGTKVLARVNDLPWNGRSRERPAVLAIHGLTACDRAPYMLSSARTALESGFDSIRLNVRNCGGTEHLCRTLYHSGLTVDLRKVVEELAPRPLYLLGFSMGGNMALKLAGEWGASPPAHVRAVCAVSAPVQLDLCSTNIGRPRNVIYERRFLRQLRAAVRRKSVAMPDVIPDPAVANVGSIWQFDDEVTAPAFGFRDAADYYRRCSAAGFLSDIRLPSLLIQARDDPFIAFETYDLPALRENPWLVSLSPEHGGHVAFVARGRPRFWAIEQAARFFAAIDRCSRATSGAVAFSQAAGDAPPKKATPARQAAPQARISLTTRP